MTNQYTHKITLPENGLDFVREGVATFDPERDDQPVRVYKYALLHVFEEP